MRSGYVFDASMHLSPPASAPPSKPGSSTDRSARDRADPDSPSLAEKSTSTLAHPVTSSAPVTGTYRQGLRALSQQ